MNKELFDKIGNTKIQHWDVDNTVTINDYLRTLLLALLAEGESFSGKRPLGNSDWEDVLPRSLAIAGILEYERIGDTEDEEQDNPSTWEIDYDEAKADELIRDYIKKIFKGHKVTNKQIKNYAKEKNRMGFTSFIDDKDKIEKIYEEILKIEDNSFIDEMDHWAIAVVYELGIRKEYEIIKLKKKIRKLEHKIANASF